MFRRYSPVQGRWISPDPAGLGAVDPSNPQTWNRYAYVLNNPAVLIDPLGLYWLQACTQVDGSDPVCNWYWEDGGSGGGPAQNPGGGPPAGGGGGGGSGAANNDPQTGVPANPCTSAGGAPNPSMYAAAGTIAQVSEFLSPGGLLVNAAYLLSFPRGGALDAQPLGASRAYGNYVFGAYLSAAGIPLSVGLAGANGYAAVSNAQYPGFTMDPNYPAIPQANVANIVNGYNAQRNGTLCHK